MSHYVLLWARELCDLWCEPLNSRIDCPLFIRVDILIVLLKILVLRLMILLILLIINYALTLCEIVWRCSSAASTIATQIHLTIQESRHVWFLHLFFRYLTEDGTRSAAWSRTPCISKLLGNLYAGILLLLTSLVFPVVPGDNVGLQVMPEVEGWVDFVVRAIMKVRVSISLRRLRRLKTRGGQVLIPLGLLNHLILLPGLEHAGN